MKGVASVSRQERFWQGKCALITGASSGIGQALALELADLGAEVGLVARRADRLDSLVQRIRRQGRRAWALPADVSQRSEVHEAARRLQRERGGPIDVLIANAGRGTYGGSETDGRVVTDVHAVNFLGAVYALEAVLPEMLARRQGHIAAISSGTALLPRLAASPAYASSKAAMGRYFEGIGRELRFEGIAVTVVYPGFVRTEMTSGHRWMPFALEAPDAARLIARAIAQGRPRFIFPRRALWLGRLVQLMPTRFQLQGRRRLAGKPLNKEPREQ